MKRLVVLGSTGSIGRQTLDICRSYPDRFEVAALVCGKNFALLEQQVAEFHPRFVFHDLTGAGPRIKDVNYLSPEEIASLPDVDLVVVGTSGKAGLGPTLAAISSGKMVALANKEVLVMAGNIIMREAEQKGTAILPVDSEHSALWQCLLCEYPAAVFKLVLTASGGPFRKMTLDQLASVTAKDALAHPTWDMGRKVTIDSATLMNKGMEVIEAHWLFSMPMSDIEVVIHPQSIVHSIVKFVDGSAKAQLSVPDMRLPIQYALTYPERWVNAFVEDLDLVKTGTLSFEAVDYRRFPCLELALEAGRKGGCYPAVLSAADEVAVELFLAGKIGFMEIGEMIGKVLSLHRDCADPSIEDILEADAWAGETARSIV